ncbi:hypothetical protein JA1_001441 [Spathaspora sp. JA1]|nr:hypothetical protein JA1_001441 [Spathaspora sp. JA1]
MSLTFYTTTGNIKVELYSSNDSSILVENFLRHVAKGSYENLAILRFIPDFILQTGSPNNRSTYSIPADTENALQGNDQRVLQRDSEIERGTLFTINTGAQPDSQFFILLNTKHLDVLNQSGSYTAIGHIIDGIDAIEKVEGDIQVVDHISSKPIGKWKKKIWINRIEIHNNPFAGQSSESEVV